MFTYPCLVFYTKCLSRMVSKSCRFFSSLPWFKHGSRDKPRSQAKHLRIEAMSFTNSWSSSSTSLHFRRLTRMSSCSILPWPGCKEVRRTTSAKNQSICSPSQQNLHLRFDADFSPENAQECRSRTSYLTHVLLFHTDRNHKRQSQACNFTCKSSS